MGTNYYMIIGGGKPCPTCGHVSEPAQEVHIGKSSMGWCFGLHADPEVNGEWDGTLWDLERWQEEWIKPGVKIVDEYGLEYSPGDMTAQIVDRRGRKEQWPKGWWVDPFRNHYKSEEHFHECNGSMRGPRGLLRRRISEYCAGHGSGTWDLMLGDFT